MSGKIHRFQVGDFECLAVADVQGSGNPGGAFPDVSAEAFADAARALGYDPEAIPQQCIPLAINTGDQWLLLDTGNPQGDAAGSGKTLRGLRAAGVAPEDIAVVVISHCHPDHIGGLSDDEGQLHYPNARYVIWKAEWQHWLGETGLAQWGEEYAAFLRAKLLPLQAKITLLDAETEIVPGVSALSLPGHTPGHMGLRLHSAGERLLDIVDTAHVLVQMAHPEWSPRYDTDPAMAAVTRRKVFAQAAQEKLLVMGFHFPVPGLGHIVPEGDAFKWQPVEA